MDIYQNQSSTKTIMKSPLLKDEKILISLKDNWQTLDDILLIFNIRSDLDKRFIKLKLKMLERKEKIIKKKIEGKYFWKST